MARYFNYTSGIVDNVVKSITFHKFKDEITVIDDKTVKIEADDVMIAEWLEVQNCDPIELSPEESTAFDKVIEKTKGAAYGAYKIPFTNEDAMGMLQVKAGFEMGLSSTNIEFSNGTVMPMDSADFPAFAMWFVEKRNGYFI